MTETEIEISLVRFAGEHALQIMRTRQTVFTGELGIEASLDLDGLDDQAVHVLASAAGQPVGTARMLADGHIGRVAVLRSWRRRQIGSQMVLALLEYAGDQGIERVFLGAQCSVADFYRRLGFRVCGEPYFEVGICHLAMERRLSL